MHWMGIWGGRPALDGDMHGGRPALDGDMGGGGGGEGCYNWLVFVATLPVHDTQAISYLTYQSVSPDFWVSM